MVKINIESIDSTNTYAKEIAKKIKKSAIIVADKQLSGYGTNNRKWYSDINSIICSFVIKKSNKNIPLDYSYKIGKIVSNTINIICNIDTYVKKPNDICFNGKKLGGILIETQYSLKKLEYVIIGIGINVNQKLLPNDIRKIATSLFIETEKQYNKEDIINGLIKEIESEEY